MGAGHRGGVVREGFDAEAPRDRVALLGVRIAGADAHGRKAVGQQPADQAAGHVAGADETELGFIHGGTCTF